MILFVLSNKKQKQNHSDHFGFESKLQEVMVENTGNNNTNNDNDKTDGAHGSSPDKSTAINGDEEANSERAPKRGGWVVWVIVDKQATKLTKLNKQTNQNQPIDKAEPDDDEVSLRGSEYDNKGISNVGACWELLMLVVLVVFVNLADHQLKQTTQSIG